MGDDNKGRVLLVDDDPGLRETYSEALRDAGYGVDTATSGRAAMEMVGSTEFDVILTDIQMPDMDGIHLVRSVRERGLDVPVLLMTGSPALETAIQALEQGALRYLLKPIAEAELRQAVDRAAALRRLAKLKRVALAHLGGEDWRAADRVALSAGLGRALDSLWMAYQPIVRASNGAIFGHEALVRSEERSFPHPGALFEAAERLGRVPELGRAVRRRVAAGTPTAGVAVFVNLHSLELLDETLFSPEEALSKRAASVVLEITERASLEAIPDVRRRVRALRDLGFRIAVDDLGAGYAGLTSFAALEPDVVKLDMSLVRGVEQTPLKRRLIGSFVAVCKDMGTLVVAEGVETEAERSVLVELGCDLLQGFLIGRPAGAA